MTDLTLRDALAKALYARDREMCGLPEWDQYEVPPAGEGWLNYHLEAYQQADAALSILSDALAQRDARIAELEARLTKRLGPDMFWDADNPEQPFDNVECLLNELDYEGEGVVEVRRAARFSNAAYHYKMPEPDTDDDIELVQLSDDQYREMIACRCVGNAFRALFDARANKIAKALFEQSDPKDVSLRPDLEWRHLPYHVKMRFVELARTKLKEPHNG